VKSEKEISKIKISQNRTKLQNPRELVTIKVPKHHLTIISNNLHRIQNTLDKLNSFV